MILAIPAATLKAFVTDNIQHLKDRALVDATNSTVRGEGLDAMLCMTNIRWVKAFNDIGAVDFFSTSRMVRTRSRPRCGRIM